MQRRVCVTETEGHRAASCVLQKETEGHSASCVCDRETEGHSAASCV